MQKQISQSPPQDAHGRILRYLRLSVTDRCNLACSYCVSQRRQQFIPHASILRYEEYLRIARIGESLGIRKTRITGGEPFARRGIVEFLQALRKQSPDMQLCITTNATLIEPFIPDLAKLGLSSINISLDSFDAGTVATLTGQPCMSSVLRNMEALLQRGQRVKINAVSIRGITDVQIKDYIHAIRQYPVDLRFIEFMPMGNNTQWDEVKFIPSSELIELANRNVALKPVNSGDPLAGPAKLYEVEGARGRFGFISAVSNHFCSICNRLRLTSDGHLRSCLFSDKEYALAYAIRSRKVSDGALARIMLAVMARKPLGNALLTARGSRAVASRQMVGIGG